jgi:hypothetical protein
MHRFHFYGLASIRGAWGGRLVDIRSQVREMSAFRHLADILSVGINVC